jgi:hypothetical protein
VFEYDYLLFLGTEESTPFHPANLASIHHIALAILIQPADPICPLVSSPKFVVVIMGNV